MFKFQGIDIRYKVRDMILNSDFWKALEKEGLNDNEAENPSPDTDLESLVDAGLVSNIILSTIPLISLGEPEAPSFNPLSCSIPYNPRSPIPTITTETNQPQVP